MSSEVNLWGKQLNVATNLSPPYVVIDYDSNTSKWVLRGGTEVKLLECLSKFFNFTYNVMNCNSDWGVLYPNHSWSGLMGKVVSKEADMAFAGLTVTEERSRYVHFTEPHIITSVSFITHSPKPQPKVALVIEPFEGLVWLCIILSLLAMVSTEWLIAMKWISIKHMDIKWSIVSALLKQSFPKRLPNIMSLRIMNMFWLLACLVLTASYSGCLYSSMAIPSRVKPINTLAELANRQTRGQIQVTAIGGSAYFDSLKHSKSGVYKTIGELLKPVKNKKEGLDIVRNSDKPYAYISTRDHLRYGLLLFGTKTLHLPPQTEESTLFVDVMAIALQKSFKFQKHFNKLISDVKKGGLLDYWGLNEMIRLVANNGQNDGNDKREHNVLHLDQLQSACYLYLIGHISAVVLLIIEIILKKYYTFRQNLK